MMWNIVKFKSSPPTDQYKRSKHFRKVKIKNGNLYHELLYLTYLLDN